MFLELVREIEEELTKFYAMCAEYDNHVSMGYVRNHDERYISHVSNLISLCAIEDINPLTKGLYSEIISACVIALGADMTISTLKDIIQRRLRDLF